MQHVRNALRRYSPIAAGPLGSEATADSPSSKSLINIYCSLGNHQAQSLRPSSRRHAPGEWLS
jgi:hypothetical protein